MNKSALLLLSTVCSLLNCTVALAQYNDPRYPTPAAADRLDSIYDRINADARQAAMGQTLGPRARPHDVQAYNQFMNQTQNNIDLEYSNVSQIENARSRDARTTQAYEEKRVSDLAAWERAQMNTAAVNGITSRGALYSTMPANMADLRAVDDRRRTGVLQSQDALLDRLRDTQKAADMRGQALQDSANNLRDQILNKPSDKAFGLQGVGTNLYVRQYGRPDAKLPPVHNAAARIVPLGEGD
ncbi:MAG: hypothetical protein KGS72_08690 [Cyanobacteria bacterium REEB67]|nr:hypothetical protein [Cyanobacteria bacterium REEB67]